MPNQEPTIIVVDSGRQFVKAICGQTLRLIPSVVAPAREFLMDLNLSDPKYHWVIINGNECFVGDLALDQAKDAAQERDPDKSNRNNHILIVTACASFIRHSGEQVTLLTNCPARDWKRQRDQIRQAFIGNYWVTKKAGPNCGEKVEFDIVDVKVLPEGAMAYFGYIYNSIFLNQRHPEFLKANVLVMEIGDQTINYISMMRGAYRDDDCGSLDLGLYNAHADVQKWLEAQGVEITQSELSRIIIGREDIYRGKIRIDYRSALREIYAGLVTKILNQLQSRLKFGNYQYLLLAGGGAGPLQGELQQRLGDLLDIHCPEDSQWLNACGAKVMYELNRKKG